MFDCPIIMISNKSFEDFMTECKNDAAIRGRLIDVHAEGQQHVVNCRAEIEKLFAECRKKRK